MFPLAYNFPTATPSLSKFCWKKYVQTKWIIQPSKLRQVETPWIFRRKKLHRKKYVEARWIIRPSKLQRKSTWEQREFFDHRNYIKKVRGNDADFSISEITSKKYVEMMWKFVEIWSSAYWCNIHVESTLIRRGVPIG